MARQVVYVVLGKFFTSDGEEFADVIAVCPSEAAAEQEISQQQQQYPRGNISSVDFDWREFEIDMECD